MNFDFRDCLTEYHSHGVSFSYPGQWTLEEQQDGNDVLLTVSVGNTCFWLLRILPECPPPPQVVDSCVRGFREEYEDVEVEKTEDKLAEMPAVARDLQFFCLELVNSAALRSVRTSTATLLVWWQGTDHELRDVQEQFRFITSSVRFT